VLLAVSELVTNAIVHGRGQIDVHVTLRSDLLRVEVCDEGGGVAAIRPTHDSGDHIGGWGLRMVDSIADRWESHRLSPAQTVVWFERTVHPTPSE
jgi:serine/threonine-protein kinase RsbW